MKKRILALLLVLILSLGTAFAAPEADRAGNPISIPESVKTIVSLTPATTQIIEGLGLIDKLIGVDANSGYTVPETASLPQFDMMALDGEGLLALSPDLIFVSSMTVFSGENTLATLRELGVTIVEIPTATSIEGIREDILFVGDCLSVADESAALVAEMDAAIAKVSEIGATIVDKKSVMFEISALPYLYSFGTGVYLNEMIELIGATNVFADQEGWLAVSEESAVAANPDVILTSVSYIPDPVGEILGREGWDAVTAVADAAVYPIDENASNLPNQHIVDALIEMALAVYPAEFAALVQ